MQDLKDILGICSPRRHPGGGVLGAAAAHETVDVETVFAVSNVLRKDVHNVHFEAMPVMTLARFQFLEAFVRVAVHQFVDPGEHPDHAAAAAVSELLERSSTNMKWLNQRQTLHEHLFREECDLLYRECRGLLEAVYEAYRTKLCYPGRPAAAGLSFGAWLLLCEDAEVAQAGLTPRTVGYAFALGRQHHDVESFRHMELSLGEFFVALGALVALRVDFDPAELGDMSDGLAELFIENMAEALKKVSAGAADEPASLKTRMCGHKVKPVLDFVMRTFRAADADNSATVGGDEFRRVFSQPGVLSELADLGIRVEDGGCERALPADRRRRLWGPFRSP
ncbi:unnamed protein product [Prorocentrum cordatum]|uniref:Calmodulin n=1 Tax=Prorocentrum cordatum TaxID=2364126 RepID=A0ABN9W8L9_9DINO|nr:unnamed protein product [Polarella glacialis]